MKRIIYLFYLLALVFIVGCSHSTPNLTQPVPDTGFKNIPPLVTESGDTKVIPILARQWKFEPETVKVNKGENVVLLIKSVDVDHGVSLPDFGVNSFLNSGEITKVEFTADKSGEFTFFCNVYCGSGHSHMKGKLIVS